MNNNNDDGSDVESLHNNDQLFVSCSKKQRHSSPNFPSNSNSHHHNLQTPDEVVPEAETSIHTPNPPGKVNIDPVKFTAADIKKL